MAFLDKRNFSLKMIPDHMIEGVQLYIERGVEPGAFLSLIIQNDFANAAAYADDENKKCLLGWCFVLHNLFPAASWGSVENMERWMRLAKDSYALKSIKNI